MQEYAVDGAEYVKLTEYIVDDAEYVKLLEHTVGDTEYVKWLHRKGEVKWFISDMPPRPFDTFFRSAVEGADFVNMPRLIMSQMRWLDRVVDGKVLTQKMFEIVFVTPGVFPPPPYSGLQTD